VLRHTGNTLASKVPGTTVRDLTQRMGHDSSRAAMIYLHTTRDADRAIADALPVEVAAENQDDEGDDGLTGVLVPAGKYPDSTQIAHGTRKGGEPDGEHRASEAADVRWSGGAGDGNRTRTISLEG
jgi:hypothetical protein